MRWGAGWLWMTGRVGQLPGQEKFQWEDPDGEKGLIGTMHGQDVDFGTGRNTAFNNPSDCLFLTLELAVSNHYFTLVHFTKLLSDCLLYKLTLRAKLKACLRKKMCFHEVVWLNCKIKVSVFQCLLRTNKYVVKINWISMWVVFLHDSPWLERVPMCKLFLGKYYKSLQ